MGFPLAMRTSVSKSFAFNTREKPLSKFNHCNSYRNREDNSFVCHSYEKHPGYRGLYLRPAV
jgi:hypothetical protein